MSAVLQPDEIVIRPMEDDDIPQVLVAERQCYEFPWSAGIFADCLRVGYCCWVLDGGEGLLGHGIMSVAAEESHILNICVIPDARRLGHARTLMNHLLEIARQHGARISYLEVRPSNGGAIELYKTLGFREVGRRTGYYPATVGREDALVLSTALRPGQGREQTP